MPSIVCCGATSRFRCETDYVSKRPMENAQNAKIFIRPVHGSQMHGTVARTGYAGALSRRDAADEAMAGRRVAGPSNSALGVIAPLLSRGNLHWSSGPSFKACQETKCPDFYCFNNSHKSRPINELHGTSRCKYPGGNDFYLTSYRSRCI